MMSTHTLAEKLARAQAAAERLAAPSLSEAEAAIAYVGELRHILAERLHLLDRVFVRLEAVRAVDLDAVRRHRSERERPVEGRVAAPDNHQALAVQVRRVGHEVLNTAIFQLIEARHIHLARQERSHAGGD